MKMQNLRLSTFLGLLIYLFVASYVVAKSLKGTVIFTRGGIVIELEERLKRTNQPDRLHPLPSLVIHEASEPPEEIFTCLDRRPTRSRILRLETSNALPHRVPMD